MSSHARLGFRKGNSSDNPDRTGKGAGYRDKSTIKRLNMYRARAIRDKTGKVIGGQLMMKGRAGDAPISGATGRVYPDRRWFGNTRVVGAKELDTFREEMGKRAHDPYTVILKEKRLPMGLLTDTSSGGSTSGAGGGTRSEGGQAAFRRSGALLSAESFYDTFGKRSKRKRPRIGGLIGELSAGGMHSVSSGDTDLGALAAAAGAKRAGYSKVNVAGQVGDQPSIVPAPADAKGEAVLGLSNAEADLLASAGNDEDATAGAGSGSGAKDILSSGNGIETGDGGDLLALISQAEAQGKRQAKAMSLAMLEASAVGGGDGEGDIAGAGSLETGAGTDSSSVGGTSVPSAVGAVSVAATAGTAGSVGGGDVDRQRFALDYAGGAEWKNESREKILNKGYSRRIWGELFKVLDCSDVVVQVLDARDPIGTRSLRLEKHLKSNSRHKHLILVLNKCDLVPTWVTRRWVQRLSKEVPTLAFHASVTRPFGKGALIALLQQFARLHSDKPSISVGFVGFPNVGKSSMINSLRGKKACNVAPVPGETKIWQYVTLFKSVLLVDCPGVVPPEQTARATPQSVVLRGVARAERLEDPEEAAEEAIRRSQRIHLEKTYGVPAASWTDPGDFLRAMARRMGKLRKGGIEDTQVVARVVINDWQRGKLPWFIAPPEDGDESSAHALAYAQARAQAEESAAAEAASKVATDRDDTGDSHLGAKTTRAIASEGDGYGSGTMGVEGAVQEVPGATGVMVPAQDFEGVGDHWEDGGAQAALAAASQGGGKDQGKGRGKGRAKGKGRGKSAAAAGGGGRSTRKQPGKSTGTATKSDADQARRTRSGRKRKAGEMEDAKTE